MQSGIEPRLVASKHFLFSQAPSFDDKKEWEEFRKIDMDTFFLKTMPEIYIEHCMFDTLDCRHIWKLRKTKLGNCVQD